MAHPNACEVSRLTQYPNINQNLDGISLDQLITSGQTLKIYKTLEGKLILRWTFDYWQKHKRNMILSENVTVR